MGNPNDEQRAHRGDDRATVTNSMPVSLRMRQQHLLQVQILLDAPERFVADLVFVAQAYDLGALRGDHLKPQPPVIFSVLAILHGMLPLVASRQAMGAVRVLIDKTL